MVEEQTFAGLQRGYRLHIRRVQGKIKDVEVLRHPLLSNRLRNDDDIALRQPSENDLGDTLAVFFRDGRQHLVVKNIVLSLSERAPRFDLDIVFFEKFLRLHLLVKWVRRLINWNGRQAPLSVCTDKIAPLLEQRLAKQKTSVVQFLKQNQKIVAHVCLAEQTIRVPVDKYGVALWKPIERDVMPPDCAVCSLVPICKELSALCR